MTTCVLGNPDVPLIVDTDKALEQDIDAYEARNPALLGSVIACTCFRSSMVPPFRSASSPGVRIGRRADSRDG